MTDRRSPPGTDRRPRTAPCFMAAAVLYATAATTHAGDSAHRGTVLPTGGRVSLLVESPDARSSIAAHPPGELVSKSGDVPPPLFDRVVHARVLVQHTGRRFEIPSTRPLGDLGVRSVTPLASVAGFVAIECESVRSAADLADWLGDQPGIVHAELDTERPKTTRSLPSDPGFPEQWHLDNTDNPSVDLNVTPVWAMGITGAGVTVGVVEGGWQDDHPDLIANFDAGASMPGGSATSHSTSCAGIIAASADNGIGGVGVAHGARVSKLIYGGPPSATADALAFRDDLNPIKSNSWGPPDFGILAGISAVELAALEQYASGGRSGLGTVFVWSAGNGGEDDDRVDYDPYASSRHTIAIGSITENDTSPSYAEPGSSLFAVVPSNGGGRGIFTTANNSGYNPDFGGTSAACPQAAGVIALMLEANPTLSARDIRHIIARTARLNDPQSTGWEVNAAGHAIHPMYGFGTIDAHAAVLLAQAWSPVGPESLADSGVIPVGAAIPDNSPDGVTLAIEIDEPIDVEHAELILGVRTNYVGDLSIRLTSPSGTVSVLAEPRDDPQNDLDQRVFTSVRHWDEPGEGTWTVHIADRGPLDLATWDTARIALYGTEPDPSCGTPDLAEPFGVLNFFDLAAFIALFNTRDAAADLDANGLWNFFDLAAFIAEYSAGCP